MDGRPLRRWSVPRSDFRGCGGLASLFRGSRRGYGRQSDGGLHEPSYLRRALQSDGTATMMRQNSIKVVMTG